MKRKLHGGLKIWKTIIILFSSGKNSILLTSHRSVIFSIYYMEESVLLGTKPLVDSTRHSIRDPSGVFSVCHAFECHIVQWRHDSRLYYFVEWTECVIASVLFRIMAVASRFVLLNDEQVKEFSESFDNENPQKKTLYDFKVFKEFLDTCDEKRIKMGNFRYLSPYNKKNITRWLEDVNFMFSWQTQYLTSELRSLVRYCVCHENIKFIIIYLLATV